MHTVRKIAVLLLAVSMFFALCGCGKSQASPASTSSPAAGEGAVQPFTKVRHAEITVKDYGTIKLELDEGTAPITVENFIRLAKEDFYDGLTFHRIMDGFMIQGGDPLGNGTGGSKDKIKGEFASNGVENQISHVKGVISMARANDPNSASSQFFIVHEDAEFLDGQYAAFGMVIEGMDVVKSIQLVETDGNDRPLQDVVIRRMTVEQ